MNLNEFDVTLNCILEYNKQKKYEISIYLIINYDIFKQSIL